VFGVYATKAVRSTYAAAATSAYAAAAATSAAATFSAASVGANAITEGGIELVMSTALWREKRPDPILAAWDDMRAVWAETPSVWAFWTDWYEGLLEGRTPDWALWHDVVLIPNDVWDAGPEAVAKAIVAIKAARKQPPLSEEQITAQAQRLIAKPRAAAFVGHDVATKIEDAISDFCCATKSNALPAELERLHALPALLRGMAETSQSADRITELEKQIVAWVAETIGLSRDVQGLKAALAAKSASSLGKIAKEEVVKTTAKVFTTGFWGTVVVGVSHMTGIVDFGSALEMLSTFGSEIEESAPITIAPLVDV
jgi:hypothetical protein